MICSKLLYLYQFSKYCYFRFIPKVIPQIRPLEGCHWSCSVAKTIAQLCNQLQVCSLTVMADPKVGE